MCKDEMTDLNPAYPADSGNIIPDWQVDSAGNTSSTGVKLNSSSADSKAKMQKSKRSVRRQAVSTLSAYPLLASLT
ncbi:hypothetical protein KEF85_08405 [Methylomonas paludis]|uniref:Uncharacterized protein n=1 Tax=Methylomonas paludis TaxID=1173101 RepID=A0A975MKC3_9GAMM|nr:hypothetical protein [Methylomonas paludis]QWF69406.1 hypothetical protein KEF85_08405 [Methylomonas paludis]